MNPNRFSVWVRVRRIAHQRNPLSWEFVSGYSRNRKNVNPNRL